jgi:hypothetical protein
MEAALTSPKQTCDHHHLEAQAHLDSLKIGDLYQNCSVVDTSKVEITTILLLIKAEVIILLRVRVKAAGAHHLKVIPGMGLLHRVNGGPRLKDITDHLPGPTVVILNTVDNHHHHR